MDVRDKTHIIHCYAAGGKNISAFFLGVKNTIYQGRQFCDDKQAPLVLASFKLIVRCF